MKCIDCILPSRSLTELRRSSMRNRLIGRKPTDESDKNYSSPEVILAGYRKEALAAADGLCYSETTKRRIRNAENVAQITNVMKTARLGS